MSVTITRNGYGQVEPNHMSAPRDGRVYAQLPFDPESSITTLEQGMFVKYDYAAGKCVIDASGNGPWYMVYNEEKLYDERHQMHKDYAMKAADFYDGKMYPRVFGLVPGDIFTTNTFADNTTLAVGTKLDVDGTTGMLVSSASGNFIVAKETTMPDGQLAVKVQVIG